MLAVVFVASTPSPTPPNSNRPLGRPLNKSEFAARTTSFAVNNPYIDQAQVDIKSSGNVARASIGRERDRDSKKGWEGGRRAGQDVGY